MEVRVRMCVDNLAWPSALSQRSGESYRHNSKKPRKCSIPAAKCPEEKLSAPFIHVLCGRSTV